MSDITIDRVVLPLHCHFVGCTESWPRAIRRHMAATDHLLFHHIPTTSHLVDQVPSGSVVVLQLKRQEVESGLQVIHDLFQKRVRVVVVGDREIGHHSIFFRAAGAVAVVTDIFECGKVAVLIQKAAGHQREIFTGWQTRFVNRLPWNPV